MAITDKWKTKDPSDPTKRIMLPKDKRPPLRWRADYTEPTSNGGNRRRKDFATKPEAEAYHAKMVQQVRGGDYVNPKLSNQITVSELNTEFVERMRTRGVRGNKPAAPKTLDNYRRRFENYIEPRWGTAPLASVTYDQTADWIHTLIAQDGGAAGDPTKRAVASSFSSLMNHAVRLRYLPANPARDPAGGTDYMPRAKSTRKHVYLSMTQLLLLASHAGDYADMILTAGLCGLRWGEVAALQAQDVATGTDPHLNISRSLSELPAASGGLTTKSTKSDEPRLVPMPSIVANAIAHRVTDRPGAARVFSSANDSALRNSNFTRRYYAPAIAAAQAADPSFPRPTFHDLRHTAVSLAIRAGANVKVVQQIAGHASATLTLDTYAGLFTDDLHDSARRLNDAVDVALRDSSSLSRNWPSSDPSVSTE